MLIYSAISLDTNKTNNQLLGYSIRYDYWTLRPCTGQEEHLTHSRRLNTSTAHVAPSVCVLCSLQGGVFMDFTLGLCECSANCKQLNLKIAFCTGTLAELTANYTSSNIICVTLGKSHGKVIR